ncbi:MAG: hypothetical protein ACLRZG_04820 [Streptococcus sp.]
MQISKILRPANYYNPTTKKVEKPEKPTEKRVTNVPISVEFNFTKKLKVATLKLANSHSELKDSDNVVIGDCNQRRKR